MRRAIFASTLALSLSATVLSTTGAAQDDDLATGADAICCGSECCFIAGACFGRGDENPADSCEVCDPSTSQTAFTAVDGCGGEADAGSTTPPADAGSTTPPADAGSTTPPDDGGGCSVGAAGSSAPLALLALVGGLALWRRRR